MIDWSHFAGSLWDNILAAHVHSDNLADKVLSFEAAVDDFDTNLRFLGVGEHGPVYPCRRFQYVRMCFNNLRLMGQRAISPSLQLEGRAGAPVQVAFTSIASARCQGWDTKDAFLLRYQMVTTLAASLHMLCSTLVSNRSFFKSAPSNSTSQCQEHLDATVKQLHTLAQGVPLAQRVLGDLDQIIQVIREALTMMSEESASVQRTAGWAVWDDVLPPNAAELLPYREQVPHIGFPMLYNGIWATNGGYVETDRGFSPWGVGHEPGGARNSVLWV